MSFVQAIDFRDLLNIKVSRINTNIRLSPRIKYKLYHRKKLFSFIQFKSELANGNFLKLDILITMTTLSVSPAGQKKTPILKTPPSTVISNAMIAWGSFCRLRELKPLAQITDGSLLGK